MADESPGPEPTPAPAPASPLTALSGDAGCVVVSIPLAAAGASIYGFRSAVDAGAAWAGAAAVAALSAMALGVVWVLVRSRS